MTMNIKNLISKLTLGPSIRKGLGVGIFLILGSTSLMAQGDDPFGEVDSAPFQNSMSVTGYVRLGGEVLGPEAVVAAYMGSELRGKSSPQSSEGAYANMMSLLIYGDKRGEPIHFKVFTGGRVIEVDQGVTYVVDQRLGTLRQPYYIDLPSPVVTTFFEEGWATTCLPYNAEIPDGVTVWIVIGIEDGELVLEEVTGNILPKNTPVLLEYKSDNSQSSPITCEWLSRVADGDVDTSGSILQGTTEPTEVTSNSVLTLDYSKETNELGFWLYSDTTIPANSAYISDFPADSQGAKLPIENTTSGIKEIENSKLSISKWFDLLGRSIETTNLRKGIYVINGKKTIIK